MDTYECIQQCSAAILEGNRPRVLDWEKVARYIIEIGGNCVVYAGIQEDWDNTGGIIYDHGEVVHNEAYTTSIWGTPTIVVYIEGRNKRIDADSIFYKEANEHIHDWTAESIAILEGK
jgi:hypothetical protein